MDLMRIKKLERMSPLKRIQGRESTKVFIHFMKIIHEPPE